MSKGLKEIIEALSRNEEYSKYTYVGKNYSKQDLIDDLFALKANYPFTQGVLISESKPKKKSRGAKMRDRLVKRDGIQCFYCGISMSEKEMTIEHLTPKSKGGKDKISNLKLAHNKCNVKAGSLGLLAKIKLRKQPVTKKINGKYILDYGDYTAI